MTPMRKVFIALVGLISITGMLLGCSSKQSSNSSLPEASSLIKPAVSHITAVNSAHLVLTANGTIKDFPIKTLEGDLTNKPEPAAKGTANMHYNGSDIEVKFVVFEGTLYVDMSGGNYLNMGPAADIYDVGVILDPHRGLAHLLTTLTNSRSVDHETINGQDTIKITGQAPAEAVNKVAAQLKATSPMSATVWINANTHQLVQVQLAPSANNWIQMSLSKYNSPVTVDKPAGV